MNITNNNFSNNNDKLSIVFYKVFHNKYLFNKIFQQIHSVKWIKYYNNNLIRYDNRIKFKDIISVKWMVNKNQIELLKCKLEAGDPVQFDVPLFQWINNLQDRETLFQLFLNSNTIFNKDEYLYNSLHLLDPVLLRVALNEPYSIPLLQSTIIKSISESSLKQISIIYNHIYNNNLNNNNFNNNNSLKRTRDQIDNDNNIYEHLLNVFIYSLFNDFNNNNNLYKFDNILSMIFNNSINNNNDVASNSNSNNNSYNHIHNNNNNSIYNIIQIFPNLNIADILINIISNNNKIIILNNNNYKLPDKLPNKIYNDIKLIINNNQTSTDNKLIEIINHESLNQIINIKKNISYKSLFNNSLLNLENLKLFLENNKNNWKGYNLEDRNDIKIKDARELDFDYIQYYIELENQEEFKYFRLKEIEQIIERDYMVQFRNYSNGNQKHSETVLKFTNFANSISESNSRISSMVLVNLITMVIYKNGKLWIKNKETIDYISRKCLSIFERFIGFNKIFQFSSLELYNYAKGYPNFRELLLESSCSKLIEEIILCGNIDETINVTKCLGFSFYEDIIENQDILEKYKFEEKIRLLYQCISNKNHYQIYFCLWLFSNCQLFKFPKSIKEILYEESDIKSFLFIKSIVSNDKILELLLFNDINPILYDHSTYSLTESWKDFLDKDVLENRGNDIFIYNNIYNGGRIAKLNTINSIYDSILNTVKLLLKYTDVSISEMYNQLKLQSIEQEEEYNETNRGEGIIIMKFMFEMILNYLFKRTIQIQDITIEKVSLIYQLINNSRSVKVDTNSTFFSIYYLSLRSIEYIKFIAESPLLEGLGFSRPCSIPHRNQTKRIVPNYKIDQVEHLIFKELSRFDFRHHLDPSLFNYDFIFNYDNSFEVILNKLIIHLSFDFISNCSSYSLELAQNLYNYNLEFLMDIKRQDLVLDHIDFINSIPYFNENQFQFSKKFINQCIQLEFITPLINNNYKLNNFPYNPYKNQSINSNIINQIINHFKDNNNNNNYNIIIKEIFIHNNKSVLKYNNFISQSNSFNLELVSQDFIEFPLYLSFKFYHQLLSNYPSHSIIRPSKRLISKAVESKSFLFLKYLVDNKIINNSFNNNNEYDQLHLYLSQLLIINNIEFKL